MTIRPQNLEAIAPVLATFRIHQTGGICRFKISATYPVVGNRVVGGTAGTVKQAPAVSGDPVGGNIARGTVLEVNGTTDSTGLFEVDLIPSTLLQSNDPRYDIVITRPDGVILRQRVSVPNEPVWQLTW